MERCSRSKLTFTRDVSLKIALHNIKYDMQSKASAPVAPFGRKERFEYLFEVFIRYSTAIIMKVKEPHCVLFCDM